MAVETGTTFPDDLWEVAKANWHFAIIASLWVFDEHGQHVIIFWYSRSLTW